MKFNIVSNRRSNKKKKKTKKNILKWDVIKNSNNLTLKNIKFYKSEIPLNKKIMQNIEETFFHPLSTYLYNK